MPSPLKIVLAGPPHSGKSCLRYALREALKALMPACPYPYFITACPDGEGSWFHQTAAADTDLAGALKQANKQRYTGSHARVYEEWVRTCQVSLTFVDIVGRIDEKNEKICRHATHAILISGSPEGFQEWREFFGALGVPVLAEIHSDYHAAEDRPLVEGEDGVYRGGIHHLERGDTTLPIRPTVLRLAEVIASFEFPPPPPLPPMTIDVATLYALGGTAAVEELPAYEAKAREQAVPGADVTLTGPGPIWLYLRIAWSLRGIVRSLSYSTPGPKPMTVPIFDHGPH